VTLDPTWTARLNEVGPDVAKASPAVRTLSNAKARIPLTIPLAYRVLILVPCESITYQPPPNSAMAGLGPPADEF
jgi:hypothetical protein